MSKDDLFREWKEENGAGSPLTLTHGLTRRQCLLFSLAGATELMLSGCGGGGGSASGGTGAVTGSLISGDQRAAVLTGVSTFFSQLPHTSVQDDNQKLVAYLSGNGSFAAAGSQSPGSVWARFKDGTPLILVNDGSVTAADASAMAVRAKASALSAPLGSSRAAGAATELPTGQNIYLVNCIGLFATFILPTQAVQNAYMYGVAQTAINALATELKSIGYKNVKNIEGTPVNLKGVQNADLLYLFAHLGYTILPNRSQVIGIGTSVPVMSATGFDQANYLILLSDIMVGNVGFMMYVDIDATASTKVPILKSYYFITPNFISKYMTFTNQSFVFLNGCESNADATMPLVNAFKSAGATVYAGWDNLVKGAEVSTSGQILLEEMAGQNSVLQITPPQRPFPYPSVLAHMQSLVQPGKTSGGQSYNYAQTAGLNGIANLLITPLTTASNQFGLLAPSIQNVQVGGTVSAPIFYVQGNFGSNPQKTGTVTLYPQGAPASPGASGGTALKIISWQTGQIQCSVPPSGGDIVVTVNGVASNPRRLTEWKGTLNYSGSGPGSHTESFAMKLHILVDIESYRTQAGQALTGANALRQSSDFNTLLDSTCTYSSGGNFKTQYEDTSWSGGSGLNPGGLGVKPGFHYEGTIDPVGKLLKLYFGLQVPQVVTVDYKDANGNITSTATGDLTISTADFPTHTDNPALGKISFPLGPNLEILGGSISDSVTDQYGNDTGTTNTTLSWSTIAVTSGTAPNDKAAR